jgi:deoxyadenosine/deoxycytidine kinase
MKGMDFILSLQGGMASGKTTAARYIEEHLSNVTVSYENPVPVLERVKSSGLNKFALDDYLQIQRMFIGAEIERYNLLKQKGKVVIDLGPEEIEFYTLHFPKSIGMNWDIERLLADELAALRRCQLDGILFLDAGIDTLRRRKEADGSRGRNSFEHFVSHLHAMKREWFLQSPITKFLNVNNKTAADVGQAAVDWVNSFI